LFLAAYSVENKLNADKLALKLNPKILKNNVHHFVDPIETFRAFQTSLPNENWISFS
jgi:hypothetical protein